MDEVENENLPKAGESPTLPPVDDTTSEDEAKLPLDTAEVLIDSGNPSPTTQPPPPPTHQQPQPQPQPQPETLPVRPALNRESSVPPPTQPPPAPPTTNQPVDPPEFPQEPPDSLTLADLKRLRAQFPNAQGAPPVEVKKEVLGDHQKVYDFEYTDAQAFPVEMEEWFSYGEGEERWLRMCKGVFGREWSGEGGRDWVDVGEEVRRGFVEGLVRGLKKEDEEGTKPPTTELMALTYIALGVWEETAGREGSERVRDLFPGQRQAGSGVEEYEGSGLQMQVIVDMVEALHKGGALEAIYELTRRYFDEAFEKSPIPSDPLKGDVQVPSRGPESVELWCCLTLMYLFVEVARSVDGERGKALKQDILALEPKVLNYFTGVVSKLRWDDYAPVPFTKMLLLSWKCVLVTFGGIKDVEDVKAALKKKESGGTEEEEETDARGKPVITASPLDYHLFRQEISSKYPAYQPPPPMFPLEPDNNSILPPLRHRQQSISSSASESVFTGAPSVGTQSIMHQPVHIATPAPSPPPSPAGPGKAGKKQNYQTNQMFPFLYPPLDGSSSELGGKGSTQLQDALVGRKWEGSDVPTSILEAAELFSKRMRATRALKQLWEARVDYMKVERGWKQTDKDEDEDADVDDFELVPKPEEPEQETAEQGEPLPMSEEEEKLKMVNDFYRASLPHLQSFVIVGLKFVQTALNDIGVRNGSLQPGIQFQDSSSNSIINGTAEKGGGVNGIHGTTNGVGGTAAAADEEVDKIRSQEIAQKALTGTILLLLKWFKVNHVLQFEYLCQLLLDALCVPLTLKLWQQQEIGRLCHVRGDREERGFFYFCRGNSRVGPLLPSNPGGGTAFEEEDGEEEEEEDDAAPPPIRRTRNTSAAPSSQQHERDAASPGGQQQDTTNNNNNPITTIPELDELGYPTTPLPTTPIKSYSHRNTLTSINHLRILHKLTARKTHRTLMLVSFKSSTHLRKTLRIPIPELRYYTLKLFKSQVPFCGRKWRQGNMKIITAVWLSIPAELRDDWLSGGGGGVGGAGGWGDVDGSVEDAVGLEMGLRSLTFWWNGRWIKEEEGFGKGGEGDGGEEYGFFERELEKMEGWRGGLAGLGGGEGEEEGSMGLENEVLMGGHNGWSGGAMEGY